MKLGDLPLPMHRNAPADSWTPPAGVRIVSSDNHIMEEDNFFQEHLPAKWKDKAPIFYRDGNSMVFKAEGKDFVFKGLGDDILIAREGQFKLDLQLKDMDA
jgi:hypothetical protein